MLRHKEGNPLQIDTVFGRARDLAPIVAGQAVRKVGQTAQRADQKLGLAVDGMMSTPIGRRGGTLFATLAVATLLAGAIPSRPDPNRRAGLGVNTAYAQESDRLPGVSIYPSPDKPGVMIVDALLQKNRGLLIGGEPFTIGSVDYANRLGDRCIPYAAVYFADVPHRIQAEVVGTVHVERLDAPGADYNLLKAAEDPTNPLKGTGGGPIVQNLRRAVNQINAELQQDGRRKAPEVMVGGYIVSQANGEPSKDPVVRPMFVDATLDQVADPGSRCEEAAPVVTATAIPAPTAKAEEPTPVPPPAVTPIPFIRPAEVQVPVSTAVPIKTAESGGLTCPADALAGRSNPLEITGANGRVIGRIYDVLQRATSGLDLADHPPFRSTVAGGANMNVVAEPGAIMADIDRKPGENFFNLDNLTAPRLSRTESGLILFTLDRVPAHRILRIDAEEMCARITSRERDILIDIGQYAPGPGGQAHETLFARLPYFDESRIILYKPTIPGTQVQILGVADTAFASQEAFLQGVPARQARGQYPNYLLFTVNTNDRSVGVSQSTGQSQPFVQLPGTNYR